MDATSFPSRSTRPEAGFRSLLMHLTSVVFPTPLGPSMQTSSGLSNVTEMSERTFSPPYPKDRPCSSMTVMTKPPCCCGGSDT